MCYARWYRIAMLLADVLHDFRKSWRTLLAAHIVYNLCALIVLAPVVTVMVRALVAISGKAVLSDEDILWFIFRPLGLAAFIAAIALIIVVVALRYAALMTIGLCHAQGMPMNYLQALWFVGRRAAAILRLAAQIIVRILIYAAPFVGAAAVIALLLLGRYDINFYLDERPPEFLVTVALAGTLMAIMAFVVIRVLAGWVYALPLVLFGEVTVASALRTSRQAAHGQRRVIAVWLAAWLLASTVLVTIATVLIDTIGDAIVPRLTGNIGVLVLTLGAIVLLATTINLIVTFFSESFLALLLVRLYRRKGFGRQLPRHVAAQDTSQPRWYAAAPKLNTWTVLTATITAAVAASVIGVLILDGLKFEDHAQIIAHRGASAAAPENTLAAIEQAIADGAGWVEIDVQQSADGEVVVIHDRDLMKVAGVATKVAETDYAGLSAIDIGSRFSDVFQEQRIPTLRQVLETAGDRIGVMIELKYYGANPNLAPTVVEIVESVAQAPPVKVISLLSGALQQMRELRPDWQTGLLTSVTVGNVARLDVDFLAVNAGFVTRSLVQRVHRSNKQIVVWTVNDPVSMSMMLSRGVDGIITDHPQMAVAVFRQRAELSPPERLLLYLAGLFGHRPAYREQ